MRLRGYSLRSAIFTYGGMRSLSSFRVAIREEPPRLVVQHHGRFERRAGDLGTRCGARSGAG
jgi:hypothetical protein